MENIFLSDKFWSSVKRKNLPDLLELVFEQAGLEDAAEIARNTNAMTAAAMQRMKDAMGAVEVDEPETTEEDVTVEEEDETELTYEDEASDKLTVGDIKALVATGKKKSIKAAKKALKEQFGKDHPQYKELKKLIKEA
ncbi:MAG: hypothetical protein J7J70_07905 [Deltaproteobacteria bacterium]|nr:hypothetical protein [Candidatus Tharpellaceae bacterium]